MKIHCINFSDTVIFWTDNKSIDALKDLLEVANRFNQTCICFFFPVRGSIVFGDVFGKKFEYNCEAGGTYGVNSIFGKGLIQAYLKAGQQNWAGTVIDESVVTFLKENKIHVDSFLNPFAKKFKVPYKQGAENKEAEWVLNLVETKHKINEDFYKNRRRNIIENFSNYNKRTDSEDVQIKIENTIRFLESYK